MTCIAAVADAEGVWMAGDSCATRGTSKATMVHPKVYCVGGQMLIGFAGSIRTGQLVGHQLVLPYHPDGTAVEKYLSTCFMEELRRVLRDGGALRGAGSAIEESNSANFLLAYRGRVFTVDSGLGVWESASQYAAIGTGADLALGALHAKVGMPAEARLNAALAAAAAHCVDVQPPFVWRNLPRHAAVTMGATATLQGQQLVMGERYTLEVERALEVVNLGMANWASAEAAAACPATVPGHG